MLNVTKQLETLTKVCNPEGAEALMELVAMLTMSGKDLDNAMEKFRVKYAIDRIDVGDECYYETNPVEKFRVTNIRLDEDGLGRPAYFFDGIFKDGRTICDGALRLIRRTGNYYPVVEILKWPFDE